MVITIEVNNNEALSSPETASGYNHACARLRCLFRSAIEIHRSAYVGKPRLSNMFCLIQRIDPAQIG